MKKKKYKKKWLIFTGAGKWQKKAIQEAKKMGFKVLSIDSNPFAESLKISNQVIISNDTDTILKQIKKKKLKIAGVISYCNDAGMILASTLRKHLNLFGMNEKQAKKMTNKIIQRKYFNKKKLPCPQWLSIKKNSKINYKLIDKLKFPIIIKPSDSAGSRGVNKVANFKNIDISIINAMKYSKEKKVIIEEYFDGDEYTVETFSVRSKIYILAITKKQKVPFTGKTVADYLETVENNSEIYKKLSKITRDVLFSLNYSDGPAHTEIIFNKKKNKMIIVETAARGGGFNLYDGLVKKSFDEDIIKKTILHCIGEKVDFRKDTHKHAILKFFKAKKGVVNKIYGFKKLKNKNYKNNLIGESFVKINQKTNNSNTDNDRLGYLLAWGIDKKILKQNIKKAEKKIKFIIN